MNFNDAMRLAAQRAYEFAKMVSELTSGFSLKEEA